MPLDFGDLSSLYNKKIDYKSPVQDLKFRPEGGSSSFFNYGQSGSTEKKGGLEQFGGLAKEQLERSERRRERDERIAAFSRMTAQPFGGAGLAGRQFTLGDGSLTQINPDTFEPIVIPGGGAGVAGKSTGQRVAGGALSGFVSSGFNPIGALVGGIGGLFG